MAQRPMRELPDPDLEILITPDGKLTINGRDVVLESGSVEGGCVVGDCEPGERHRTILASAKMSRCDSCSV